MKAYELEVALQMELRMAFLAITAKITRQILLIIIIGVGNSL